ncbi:MAG TPA: TIGR03067 domain-containing protein [Gemmataceae bacterium]|nr:TIGR03067 domain-containing protein [Gemmataceae bacterium]
MNRGLLFAVVAVILPASLVRADATADEWKGLVGNWKVESATLNGTDSTDMFKTLTLNMEEGKYKVTFVGMNDIGTIKLDLDKKPKQMTIVGTEGTNKDRTHHAIYELDKDMLKICYAIGGQAAPKEFESKTDSMTLLVTYKREKK